MKRSQSEPEATVKLQQTLLRLSLSWHLSSWNEHSTESFYINPKRWCSILHFLLCNINVAMVSLGNKQNHTAQQRLRWLCRCPSLWTNQSDGIYYNTCRVAYRGGCTETSHPTPKLFKIVTSIWNYLHAVIVFSPWNALYIEGQKFLLFDPTLHNTYALQLCFILTATVHVCNVMLVLHKLYFDHYCITWQQTHILVESSVLILRHMPTRAYKSWIWLVSTIACAIHLIGVSRSEPHTYIRTYVSTAIFLVWVISMYM